MSKFLVIDDGAYLPSTVYGVFATLPDAQACVDRKEVYGAGIEEWDGDTHVCTWWQVSDGWRRLN